MPDDMSSMTQLAVVGAGPAGLAAAVAAADLGLRVTLLDAGERPGGQFYRHPAPGLGAARPQALHHDWEEFTDRVRRLRAHQASGRIRYLPGHHVWTVVPQGDTALPPVTPHLIDPCRSVPTRAPAYPAPPSGPDPGRWPAGQPRPGAAPVAGAGWRLHALAGPEERAVTLRSQAVLLATGAYERQLPFAGWTLPGVVGAGGAQAMLKAGLVLPGRRIVVAGSGPLLLAVAGSLAAAGARVPAVVEASSYTGYVRELSTLLRNPTKIAEGALYGVGLLRHAVPLLTRHAVTAVHGHDRVEAVTVTRLDASWRPLPGTSRRLACDALAVGHGLLPQLELATTLGCVTRPGPDGAHVLQLDAQQRTSVPGIWSAGETGGVGGAQLALTEGELAAFSIAGALSGAPQPPRTVTLLRRRTRLRSFAAAMAVAHRPGSGWTQWLDDVTDVCRCEEVGAGRIREAVAELGARDARSVKLLTRAGMGYCQGRMCGPAVTALAGCAPAADRRPLSCPVPLKRLAELPADG
ncbi:NAD(P)/FAD-dependent oxidoreductase [Streptomyces sp. NPDC006879]|uniref:FAD/NAD(P)-dependent oxidoreductase n=1 Tax=Streptomyces sp. NPDC006879 TaxID=3364767 RepID=UPI003683037D